MFSSDDVILIKILHLVKGFNATKLIQAFQDKGFQQMELLDITASYLNQSINKSLL